MPTIAHDECIEFPNGLGCTPCSSEYAEIHDKMKAIKPDYINLDDLPPSDYQRYCELDNHLGNLQISGHIGRSFTY